MMLICWILRLTSWDPVLFLEHAVPVACPGIFQRPLQFEYARGDDFCLDDPSESELSKISQCASDRRMKMEFGRCQDPVYSRSGVY